MVVDLKENKTKGVKNGNSGNNSININTEIKTNEH